MQLRDDNPVIWFPGYWGLWGGAIDEGESPEQAIGRELREELGWDPGTYRYFTRFDFDFSFAGHQVYPRYFYEVTVPDDRIPHLVLGEGTDMRPFAGDALSDLRIVPYDAFALIMHNLKHIGRL
jgi:8-oxo-dGTP pyrophosphatase MutT (NUDIX family)